MEPMDHFQFHYSSLESVSIGQKLVQALPPLLQAEDYRRVLVVASGSLCAATGDLEELRQALAARWAGLASCVRAHTPRQDVLALLAQAREAEADLLLAIGGGSVIDACKVVQLACNRDLRDEADLLDYARRADGSLGAQAGRHDGLGTAPRLRQIAVPTTLSGAEYSNNAGVLDTAANAKEGYRAAGLCPQHIVYDPGLTRHTPQWLWLSTALRSLDHAVEGYCSADCHAYLEGHFLHALRLFAASLPRVRENPEDLAARSLNQQAVWLACCGLGTVAHGASHGIGYILGSLCAVPHGYTSCVMLPAVLAFNAEVNGARQRAVAEALGRPETSAAAAVHELVRALGLPATLSEVGVGREQLPEIARRALLHPVVRRNPRPLATDAQVLAILETAWAGNY